MYLFVEVGKLVSVLGNAASVRGGSVVVGSEMERRASGNGQVISSVTIDFRM